ncbi:MAG: ABC transporter permease subunit [Anaerolineae bacterium]|nr:ABC transporter permease subunit [Anaerolineae bacterium]MCA9891661.1 ABC transporter permease subunit [Anaerolineae bacterium]
MLNLLKHEILSRRWAIIGWGIALTMFGSMYIAVYPEFANEMQGLAGIAIYRAMGMDIGSFAGFIASVAVQILPIIFGVYIIMAGTGTLAGEEENGTLELVIAMPLPRWKILVTKALALMIVAFLTLVITGAGCSLTLGMVKQTTEADVTLPQLFVALVGAWPLMVAILAMSMFFATVMPSRILAVTVMIAFYLVSYLLQSVAALVESLEGLKTLSIFNYFDSTTAVFEEGINFGDVAILLTIAVIFFGLALVFFEQRNITVGEWPWQRRHITA